MEPTTPRRSARLAHESPSSSPPAAMAVVPPTHGQRRKRARHETAVGALELTLDALPDDVLWLVLEHLGAADAFDSVAGVSRRLRDLVRKHGTWQSLALTWPYFRKHLADLRHEDEKKWPIADPKRILRAWAARIEHGAVKARRARVMGEDSSISI
eukprot:tig00020685_g12966.t1